MIPSNNAGSRRCCLLRQMVWLLAVGLVCGNSSAFPARAAEKGSIMVEKVEYHGWKNNLRLGNGDVELIITLDVGPRIISYRLANGKNVFKNYADHLGKSGEKDWQIRGGHRLWVGPEDLTRTYALDNGPVRYQQEGNKVRLTPAADAAYGIQKEMVVELEPRGSRVTILHRIRNIGQAATELAPWALTVMAPGGVEIIPLPPKRPHPGPPQNARSPKDYAANQLMAIWPFFDFTDPRWHFGSKYITLRQDAMKGPTKIGLAHRMGWVAYLNEGSLFVKRFGYEEGKPYPDHGVNFETFTNEDMLEIESLGPLVHLTPGKDVEHTEHWELIGNVQRFEDEAGIDRNVRSKLLPK
ncbi:MAG TPA: hypothetical protein VKU02_02890 [Gemmataceae bacterium]|nr:hypothetical protein [Gemmataceae bacterium]